MASIHGLQWLEKKPMSFMYYVFGVKQILFDFYTNFIGSFGAIEIIKYIHVFAVLASNTLNTSF